MYQDVKNAIDRLATKPNVVRYLLDHGFTNTRVEGKLRSQSCPVAQYLRAETSDLGIVVATNYVGISTEQEPLFEVLPDSINDAIDYFDSQLH